MKRPYITVNIDSSTNTVFGKEAEWLFALGVLTYISNLCVGVSWNLTPLPEYGSVWLHNNQLCPGFCVVIRVNPNGFVNYIFFGDDYDGEHSTPLEDFLKDNVPARVISEEQYETLNHFTMKWFDEKSKKYIFPYKHDFEKTIIDRDANKITTEG